MTRDIFYQLINPDPLYHPDTMIYNEQSIKDRTAMFYSYIYNTMYTYNSFLVWHDQPNIPPSQIIYYLIWSCSFVIIIV